jgi:hypothetical protein
MRTGPLGPGPTESLRSNIPGPTVPRVATGWAELLTWIRRRVAEGNHDPEATWTRFEKRAARSERTDILKYIVRVGQILPDKERSRLAVVTTRLLAPIEWPNEWSEVRLPLVAALDTLVEETDPQADTSFFALHDLEGDAELQKVGHLVLVGSRDLLLRPCRRDELTTVARLCNVGITACLRAYRRTLRRCAKTATIEQGSRIRFRSAFAAYAEAAEVLNQVVGAVLFEGLDAPVP